MRNAPTLVCTLCEYSVNFNESPYEPRDLYFNEHKKIIDGDMILLYELEPCECGCTMWRMEAAP